eukprot:GFUD01088202.1.p1 GENE.GFUD01088202.1~~GFUD01088202.1.p1  ORF type:complete len:454 (+),score=102.91 GFUD01088202.1:68-1429(+)
MMACGDRVVTFQGHHSYIVSIAKLCKENGLFTDVTIMCDDGKLAAHRIVLAAVSPFLCAVLEDETIGGGQTTIIVPEVRREIVQQLLDFLYTGVMKLSQSATWELQQLVLLLQIDPQNVGVDTVSVGVDSGKADRLAMSACQTLGIKIAHRTDIGTKESPKQSPRTPKLSPSIKMSPPKLSPTIKMSPKLTLPKMTSPKIYRSPITSPPVTNGVREKPESPKSSPSYSPVRVHTPGSAIRVATPGTKPLSARGRGQVSGRGRGDRGMVSAGRAVNSIKISMSRHRTASNSRSSTESDTAETNSSAQRQGDTNTTMSVMRQADNSNVIKIVTNRKRRSSAEAPKYSELGDDDGREGTKRGRGVKTRGRSSRRGRGTGGGRKLKGLHDLENTTTWVCAICGQYDPILPGSSSGDGDTTEWIGCDCNRWFHKFCTRLTEVDDSFSCRQVHKSCLPS